MEIYTFIDDYKRIISELTIKIRNFLRNDDIKKLSEQYLSLKSPHKEESFNVFKLA